MALDPTKPADNRRWDQADDDIRANFAAISSTFEKIIPADAVFYVSESSTPESLNVLVNTDMAGITEAIIIIDADCTASANITTGLGIYWQFTPGSVMTINTGTVTTINSPEHILAPPRQHIITVSASDDLEFTQGGVVHPGWLKENTTPGTTDMTTTIQAAIDSLPNSGTVQLQAETYGCGDIAPATGTTLAGMGWKTLLDAGASRVHMVNATDSNITIDTVSNVVVRDLKMDGQANWRGDGNASSPSAGITIQDSTNVILDNIHIYDQYYFGIDCNAQDGNLTENIWVNNILIEVGCVSTGILTGTNNTNGTVRKIHYSNITVQNTWGDGIGTWGLSDPLGTSTVEDINYTNIIIKDCGRGASVGTHTGGTSSTVLTDSAAEWEPGILAQNNNISVVNVTDGNSEGVIIANTATTVTVAALIGGTNQDWESGDVYTIQSALQCFFGTTEATGVTLDGFTFEGNDAGHGIHTEAVTGWTVTNGVIRGLNNGYGLNIGDAKFSNFSNISILGCPVRGMNISSLANDCSFTNIKVNGSANGGIFGGTRNTMTGCSFISDTFGTGNTGMSITNSAIDCIFSDNIIAATGTATGTGISFGTVTSCTVKGNRVSGTITTPVGGGNKGITAETVSVRVRETVAAGTTYEVPILFVTPQQSIFISSAYLSFGADITQSDADYNTYTLRKRDSAGDNVADVSLSYTTKTTGGSDFNDHVAIFLNNETSILANIAPSWTITLVKAIASSGQAEADGMVTLNYITY